MSRHGRISGRWPAEELNKVNDDLVELLGGNIPMEAEYKAGKEVQIQLTKAVALENNRGSITAAQKAGRATKTTGPGSGDSESDAEELENGAMDKQSYVVLAIHPIAVVANPTTSSRTSQKDSKAEGISRRSQGSRYGTKKASSGISFKMYLGVRHL
jgi:hypothetical protein